MPLRLHPQNSCELTQNLKTSKTRGDGKVEGIFVCTCMLLFEPLLLGFTLQLFSMTLSNVFFPFLIYSFCCYLKLRFLCCLESDCRGVQQTLTVTRFVIESPECQHTG